MFRSRKPTSPKELDRAELALFNRLAVDTLGSNGCIIERTAAEILVGRLRSDAARNARLAPRGFFGGKAA
jgi:hypothetical protein